MVANLVSSNFREVAIQTVSQEAVVKHAVDVQKKETTHHLNKPYSGFYPLYIFTFYHCLFVCLNVFLCLQKIEDLNQS